LKEGVRHKRRPRGHDEVSLKKTREREERRGGWRDAGEEKGGKTPSTHHTRGASTEELYEAAKKGRRSPANRGAGTRKRRRPSEQISPRVPSRKGRRCSEYFHRSSQKKYGTHVEATQGEFRRKPLKKAGMTKDRASRAEELLGEGPI